MAEVDASIPGNLNAMIRIDDERIKVHLDRVVRGTVEETLNALLDSTSPIAMPKLGVGADHFRPVGRQALVGSICCG